MSETAGLKIFVGPANQLEMGAVTTGPAAAVLTPITQTKQRLDLTIPAPTADMVIAAQDAQAAATSAASAASLSQTAATNSANAAASSDSSARAAATNAAAGAAAALAGTVVEATDAKLAAQAAAALVEAPSDTVTAALIGNPETDTGRALFTAMSTKLDKAEAASTYATNTSVTTEIAARVDPLVASAIAADPTVANAAAAAVDANPKIATIEAKNVSQDVAIAAAAFARPRLLTGNAFALATGTYSINTQVDAGNISNLPEARAGALTVNGTPGAAMRSIRFEPYGRTYFYRTVNTGVTSGLFGPWEKWDLPGGVVTMPNGTDLNTLHGDKHWVVPYAANAATMINWPAQLGGFPGHLEVLGSTNNMTVQRVTGIGSKHMILERVASFPVGAWTAWEKIWPVDPGPEPVGATENAFAPAQLQQWFIRRRGGTIGTGGVAAVALRFDHGAVNFRDIVLPLLRKYQLPSGLAINPGQPRLDLPENLGVTWAEYNTWALLYGIEPHNHGMTHGAASTTAEFDYEIRQSRDLLAEKMPDCAIEGWMMPGVTGAYGGAGASNAVDSFYAYEAGRVIKATHAVASGQGGGLMRPQTGHLIDGQTHYGLDSVIDAQVAIDTIRQAQSLGAALQVFLHPSLIGGVDRTTVAVLDAVFSFIAAERDAGRLIVLTPSGLLLADASHKRRSNLLVNPEFEPDATGWTSTGWAQSGTVPTGVFTADTTEITQVLSVGASQGWARGAVREIRARVKTTDPAGVTGTLRCGTATRDFTIPAGDTGWHDVHVHGVIPLTASAITVGLKRTTGGALIAESIHADAV